MMFEINPINVRQWSRLGPRAVFGQAIMSLAEDDDRLMVLSADLGNSSGLDRFKNAYPEKFLNVGIAEQNMIGIAGGLAKEGFVVFATSFAPFIAMRASEQIRMNLGYMSLNVKAVAIGSGVSMGFLGNSHYGIEDGAVMRAIPNMTIICPADCSEIFKAVYAAASFEGPVYLRLTGAPNNSIVYEKDYVYEIGKAIVLRSGKDVVLIANGSMVSVAMESAQLLEALGVNVEVVNMHTIKPLDKDYLCKAFLSKKLIVTIEEHSIVGGLGSAVAEYKASFEDSPPQIIIGLPDNFGDSGEYNYLLKKYGLNSHSIVEKVISKIARS